MVLSWSNTHVTYSNEETTRNNEISLIQYLVLTTTILFEKKI